MMGWNSVIRLGGSIFSPEPAHWPPMMVKSLLQRVRGTVCLVLTRLSHDGGGCAPRSEVFLAWISEFISEVPQLKKGRTPQGHNCIHLHLCFPPDLSSLMPAQIHLHTALHTHSHFHALACSAASHVIHIILVSHAFVSTLTKACTLECICTPADTYGHTCTLTPHTLTPRVHIHTYDPVHTACPPP